MNSVGIGSLKEIDDLDTRREVLVLLYKLTPEERCAFLRWAANTANEKIMLAHNPPWVLVTLSNNTGEAMETLYDLCLMHSQYGLPWQVVLAELERWTAKLRKLWLPG